MAFRVYISASAALSRADWAFSIEFQADFPSFSFFLPYMVAWPVVCYPFRACWHSHFVPSLALGCLGEFFANFSLFYPDPGRLSRGFAERRRFFRIRLVFFEIFFGVSLRPFTRWYLRFSVSWMSTQIIDFHLAYLPAPPSKFENFISPIFSKITYELPFLTRSRNLQSKILYLNSFSSYRRF